MDKKLQRYGLMTLAVFVMAVGDYFFLFPNQFCFGGVTGLSTIAAQLLPVTASEFRPCLKIGEMPDWGIFLCQARRFSAGGLAPGKENQRSPDGKRCTETGFCQFSNRA